MTTRANEQTACLPLLNSAKRHGHDAMGTPEDRSEANDYLPQTGSFRHSSLGAPNGKLEYLGFPWSGAA